MESDTRAWLPSPHGTVELPHSPGRPCGSSLPCRRGSLLTQLLVPYLGIGGGAQAISHLPASTSKGLIAFNLDTKPTTDDDKSDYQSLTQEVSQSVSLQHSSQPLFSSNVNADLGFDDVFGDKLGVSMRQGLATYDELVCIQADVYTAGTRPTSRSLCADGVLVCAKVLTQLVVPSRLLQRLGGALN